MTGTEAAPAPRTSAAATGPRPRVPAPGTPDARGPWRYLWWLIASQPWRVLAGAFWGTVWMIGLMVTPYLLSRAVDDGLRAGDRGSLLLWAGALAGTGLLNAAVSIMRHRTMTLVRMDASLRTMRVMARHAARLGSSLPRRLSSGELSALQVLDVGRIAHTLTMTGPGVGSVIAYASVAVLLLTVSPLLAAVVLVGVPLLALTLGPLLRSLRGGQSGYREQEGLLTALAGDIVAGLRVLSGIGGRERFAARYRERSASLLRQGYRLGATNSWFEAVSSCLPVVFLAAVTWIAARLAVSGEITVGEVVAVYGYVAVLIMPVFFLVEAASDLTHGHVSLERVVRVLRSGPDLSEGGGAAPPEDPAELVDPGSGTRVPPGSMTALVSLRSGDAALVVDRLGRYTDSDATWGGVPLRDMDVERVRDRVLVGDNEAYLFAGPLREVVAVHGGHTDEEVMEALRTAGALDVVSSLPDGLDSAVEEQGRNLSGGQRQRVRLARAVLAEPEVLLLVEPTSAVDAHTEALVAARLHEAREGLTTVVASTSPLLLARADRVVLLDEGRAVAVGTHGELVATRPDYRALVLRGADEGSRP
ncbi:ABC transporter ATP-binding protein [Nocardiopsis dassonvillei]|uniref:ABC transporter ATP-binding protein n=1 Tax=Nocardiopsis dassonvillei TaxID=2014 RepID=UPI00157BBA0E|nr:ABC transporter ATP-binding protein [Nocardiopsis dassonvillei]